MADLTLRNVKGSPLTNQEVDDNFSNLNDDKVEKSGDTLTGDLAFGDNVKAKFGASDDLQIFHNGSHSFVQDSGAGNLYLRSNGAYVQIDGGGNGTLSARLDPFGAAELYHQGGNLKLATTSSGVDVTGTLVADGLTVDGDATLQNSSGSVLLKLDGSTYPEIRMLEGDTTDANSRITNNGGQLTFQTLAEGGTTTNRFQINHTSGDVKFYEDTGTTAKLTWDASAEHLKFSDSVEARFGDNSEFRIYHDTSDTYLVNFTQGNIYLKQETNDKDVVIQSDDGSGGSTNYFVADGSTGEAKLFHYGSEKLATKSTGIDVTGTVTADGLTVSKGSGDIATLEGTGTVDNVEANLVFNPVYDVNARIVSAREGWNLQSRLTFETGSDNTGSTTPRLNIGANGDISFYDDAGTSQDFYWDASTSKLGLGTTTPSGIIHATSSGVSTFVFEGADVGEGTLFQIRNATNNSATGNGHRLEFVHGNNNSRNVFFRTSSTGTFGRSPELYIGSQNDSGGAELDHVRIRAGGDVSFYNDDSTSEDFYWDASTSRLGLGTTSPAQRLHLDYGSNILTGSGEVAMKMTVLSSFVSAQNEIRSGVTSGTNPYMSFAVREATSPFATVERMRITQNGNVGIGTTSPARNLVVNSGSNSGFISIVSSSTQDVGLLLGDSDSDSVCQLKYLNSSNALVINTNGSEAMRIDSSGNVGIGTTSPSTYGAPELVIGDSSDTADRGLTIASGSGYRGQIFFADGTSGTSLYSGYIQYDHPSNYLRFGTAGSEAARIDSSGNLLVGTTNSSPISSNVEGISLRESGTIQASRDGSSSLVLNRKTSDGAIADFRKDGTTVGSIGTFSNDAYIATNDTGLRFIDSVEAITPFNGTTVTNRDAAISLGLSSYRFTDLYLSGGVYLGGTGSANLLDDYEEGDFTPVFADAISGGNESSTGLVGRYVKIGLLVHVVIRGTNIDTTGLTSSNNVYITGLPFTSNATSGLHAVNAFFGSGFTFSGSLVSRIINNVDYVKFTQISSGGIATDLNVSGISSGTADFKVSLTYRVAS